MDKTVFSPATAEKVTLGHHYTEVQFRGRKDNLPAIKHKNFKMNVIWLPDGVDAGEISRAAQKVCPGTEIMVRQNRPERLNPQYRHVLRRYRN